MLPDLIAGDSLDYRLDLAAHPASAGWAVSFRLVPEVPGDAIEFTGTADGDEHVVALAAAATTGWAPGLYRVAAWATLGAQRKTLADECGPLRIRPNPATVPTGSDLRSDPERALAAIKALLLGVATSGEESLRINGRELKLYPLPDLLRLQAKLEAEVNAEAAAAGRPAPYTAGRIRQMQVRMP